MFAAIGVCAGAVVLTWIFLPHVLLGVSIERCDMRDSVESKAECWDGILRRDMKENGLASAFTVVKRMYDGYPDFVNGAGGCHERGHSLGAAAYLEFYLAGEKQEDLKTFVPDIDLCSWGFFHSFTGHLFTEHPDPAFVAETCASVREHLVPPLSEHALNSHCFHGAGNGFMSTQLEGVTVPKIQRLDSFFAKPYELCNAIPGIAEKGVQDCINGIFAAFFYVYLPSLQDKDPDKNFENMFSICGGLRHEFRAACYFPVGFRLTSVAHGDPRLLAQRIMESTPDEEMRARAFEGGMVTMSEMQVITNPNAPRELFAACKELPQNFWGPCAAGIARGISFNTIAPHAGVDPQALIFCSSPDVAALGVSDSCLAFSSE